MTNSEQTTEIMNRLVALDVEIDLMKDWPAETIVPKAIVKLHALVEVLLESMADHRTMGMSSPFVFPGLREQLRTRRERRAKPKSKTPRPT